MVSNLTPLAYTGVERGSGPGHYLDHYMEVGIQSEISSERQPQVKQSGGGHPIKESHRSWAQALVCRDLWIPETDPFFIP